MNLNRFTSIKCCCGGKTIWLYRCLSNWTIKFLTPLYNHKPVKHYIDLISDLNIWNRLPMLFVWQSYGALEKAVCIMECTLFNSYAGMFSYLRFSENSRNQNVSAHTEHSSWSWKIVSIILNQFKSWLNNKSVTQVILEKLIAYIGELIQKTPCGVAQRSKVTACMFKIGPKMTVKLWKMLLIRPEEIGSKPIYCCL